MTRIKLPFVQAGMGELLVIGAKVFAIAVIHQILGFLLGRQGQESGNRCGKAKPNCGS